MFGKRASNHQVLLRISNEPAEYFLGLHAVAAVVDQGQRPVKKLAHLWSRAHAKAEGWVSVEEKTSPGGAAQKVD